MRENIFFLLFFVISLRKQSGVIISFKFLTAEADQNVNSSLKKFFQRLSRKTFLSRFPLKMTAGDKTA